MKSANKTAMPVTIYDGEGVPIESTLGLTKREYFAGLAMQGLLSGIPADGVISYKDVADDARRCADALLAELEKAKGEQQ